MTVEFAGGDHISTDEKLLEVALFITGTADFEIFVNLTAKEDLPRCKYCNLSGLDVLHIQFADF